MDASQTWYTSHRPGLTDMRDVDVAVVFLKFHPFSYLHVFVFGMLVAKFRDVLKRHYAASFHNQANCENFFARTSPKFCMRDTEDKPQAPAGTVRPLHIGESFMCSCAFFGATIGYVGLLLVFLVKDIRPLSPKLSMRLSVLMPLQGLILVGLSFKQDPISWLFSLNFGGFALSAFGNVSYIQYVLQFLVYSLWPTYEAGFGFFLYLLAASFIVQRVVQAPLQKWWLAQAHKPGKNSPYTPLKVLIMPIITMLFLCIGDAVHDGQFSGKEGGYWVGRTTPVSGSSSGSSADDMLCMCIPGWVSGGDGVCYKHVTSLMDFYTAEKNCKRTGPPGAHLVLIKDKAQNSKVQKIVNGKSVYIGHWSGNKNKCSRTASDWVWIDRDFSTSFQAWRSIARFAWKEVGQSPDCWEGEGGTEVGAAAFMNFAIDAKGTPRNDANNGIWEDTNANNAMASVCSYEIAKVCSSSGALPRVSGVYDIKLDFPDSVGTHVDDKWTNPSIVIMPMAGTKDMRVVVASRAQSMAIVRATTLCKPLQCGQNKTGEPVDSVASVYRSSIWLGQGVLSEASLDSLYASMVSKDGQMRLRNSSGNSGGTLPQERRIRPLAGMPTQLHPVKLVPSLEEAKISNAGKRNAADAVSAWAGGERSQQRDVVSGLCEGTVKYNAVNKTLIRKIVTGPEDARLLLLRTASGTQSGAKIVDKFNIAAESNIMLAFNSLPPPSLVKMPAKETTCQQSPYGKSQMFIAKLTHKQASVPAVGKLNAPVVVNPETNPVKGSRIDCGFTRIHEKNWIGFDYNGNMHFVYSIFPHVILQTRPADGACVQLYKSTYNPLSNLGASTKTMQIHGNANAVPIYDDVGVRTHYLGIFHVLNEGHYTNFLYKFQPEPPFAIMEVSQAIRQFQGNSKVFVSGLSLLPLKKPIVFGGGTDNALVVSYGVDDRESRMMVATSAFIEMYFQDSAIG